MATANNDSNGTAGNKMVECAIIFDGNNDSLKSGDTISGFIELALSDEKIIRHLHVTIEGNGEVKWPSLTFSDHAIYSTFSNSKNYLKETICMVDHHEPLLGMTEYKPVPYSRGIHTFPFTHQLSSTLPSSFEGRFGFIRYRVTAVLDILNDESITVVRPFSITFRDNNIIRPCDAENNHPFRAELSTTFTYCLFPRPLCIVMSIPHTEFIVGDDIPVIVELVNRSFASVREIIVEFIQVVSYKSERPKVHTKITETIIRKVTHSIAQKPSVAVTFSLKIPATTPPTQRQQQHIIEIYYKILVRLDARLLRFIRIQPTLTLPITVGSQSI